MGWFKARYGILFVRFDDLDEVVSEELLSVHYFRAMALVNLWLVRKLNQDDYEDLVVGRRS